jgi:hypothetical protein
MSTFELYFRLGVTHILDLAGADHILFIVALCAVYTFADWRKILILVTSFTIGHSITLALSTLSIVKVDSAWVEFLIPVTIFITAAVNIFKPTAGKSKVHVNYIIGLVFGLIHGLGFSNYLRSLLGKESTILEPLFAFNVGLEAGQIVIVAVFLAATALLQKAFHIKQREISLVVSSVVLGVSAMLILNSKFW